MLRASRRLAAVVLAIILVLLTAPAALAQQADLGEWVIVYRSSPDLADLERLERSGLRYHVLQHLPMALTRGTSEQVQAAALGPNVRSVRTNGTLELYLDRSVPAIGANRVWTELGFTGQGVAVAVLDSGINARHPDLLLHQRVIENLQLGISRATTPGAGLLEVAGGLADTDRLGHGTHVASVIAASGTEEGWHAGVAPGAWVVGVGGDQLSTWWALAAMDWVLDNHERLGIRVVNNSWGVGGSFDPTSPLNLATRALYQAGISVVFAAGNGGPSQNSQNGLSVAPWVIGVAAARNDGVLAHFSARGIRDDPLYHPTITAPGVQIIGARDPSSFIGLVSAGRATDRYVTLSGTSQAAAHVSGTLALMLEANPHLRPHEARMILVQTADPMADYDESEVGGGFLNALEAVREAVAWAIRSTVPS